MRTPMPRPLLFVFSLVATLSSPTTLPAQGILSGRTPSVTPDTTQRFDPETGLPGVEETKLDTTQRFDSETGLPLIEPSIQPQELPTDRESGAGESAMQGPVVNDIFKPAQFLARRTFPIQFTFGRATDGKFVGGNGTLSYSFSKSIEIKGSRDIYESFYLYPALTLGTIYGSSTDFTDDGLIGNFEQYQILYGIIEGYRRWEMETRRPSVFVGVGMGSYWSSSEDAGTGFVLSAGAQLEGRRLMGGLRIYRIPGLRKFVTVTNMGYQPDTYKEALIVVGVGAVIVVPWLVFLLIFPGS